MGLPTPAAAARVLVLLPTVVMVWTRDELPLHEAVRVPAARPVAPDVRLQERALARRRTTTVTASAQEPCPSPLSLVLPARRVGPWRA